MWGQQCGDRRDVFLTLLHDCGVAHPFRVLCERVRPETFSHPSRPVSKRIREIRHRHSTIGNRMEPARIAELLQPFLAATGPLKADKPGDSRDVP